MKRLLFLLIPAFAALALHAQDNAQKSDLYEIMSHNMGGFFNIYGNNEKSLFPLAAIETKDGDFIVSSKDTSGSYGELVKISVGGELVKRKVINPIPSSSFVFTYIDFICRDLNEPDAFIALGVASAYDNGQWIAKTFIAYFDDELDNFYTKIIGLPDEYQSPGNTSRQLTNEGKFLCASNLVEIEKRLYMIINRDGEIEKLAEDTATQNTDMYPYNIGVFFEYPEGNRYGHYRTSYYCPPSPRLTTRLFTFDDDFNPEAVLEYTTFTDTVNGIVSYYTPKTMEMATTRPIDDTTMLFCDQFTESHTPRMERSTLLFKTNLNGNIRNFLILGSWNDSTDRPALYQSFDYAKINSAIEKSIFVCCRITPKQFYDEPNPIAIYKVHENFDVVWHKSYSNPHYALTPTYIVATQDGGCLVVGVTQRNEYYNVFALKLDSDGTLGTDEITVRDELYCYPNPVKDVLHVGCPQGNKPTAIELYDLQGRLVRTQSKAFESIDMSQLPAGTYTLRVTMEDGKAYSDKVVKE